MKKHARPIAALSLAGLALAAVTACGSAEADETPSKATKSASSEPTKNADGLLEGKEPAVPGKSYAPGDAKLTKVGREDDDVWGKNAYVVHYAITNHGEGPGDYQVSVEFLDKDGDVLGSTGVGTEKLGEGKTSKGGTVPLKEELTNGKLSDIKDARITEVTRMESGRNQ
ncbi:hypothetical protein [Streptomyces sp. NPDC057302]|uniref:hypothetical protein n=1 Tax=Streptomyces sp. NPDC057302 TaxID=3346094 RepID=UPI003632F893